MRLSELIRERKEPILEEFQEFARTHTAPGSSMDIEALRDHAARLLDAFAHDLEQPQTDAEQERKSKGDAIEDEGAASTAAEQHGVDRANRGFSLDETFAEYRALRASVMRHWTEEGTGSAWSEVEDVIRFNEAIDQAIAESVHEYSKAVTEYREMFLAVLGHDLRSPLNAILTASAFLADQAQLSERDNKMAEAIRGSGDRMKELVDDMLDYTSSKLGRGMPLRRGAADLGEVAGKVVRESAVTHPGRELRIESHGEQTGEWDVGRIRQALFNLVDNAAQHGAEGTPITVSVSGEGPGSEIVVSVHNLGDPIPSVEWERIFEPFRRGSSHNTPRKGGSMGLGLYIARRMAEAHGGSLGVTSSGEGGTIFSLRLPRYASDEPSA